MRSLRYPLERIETLRSEHDACQQEKYKHRARREVARLTELDKYRNRWLRPAERLIDIRGEHRYEAAAAILADIHGAVDSGEGVRITRQHFTHPAEQGSMLKCLESSFQKRNLLELCRLGNLQESQEGVKTQRQCKRPQM